MIEFMGSATPIDTSQSLCMEIIMSHLRMNRRTNIRSQVAGLDGSLSDQHRESQDIRRRFVFVWGRSGGRSGLQNPGVKKATT